MSDSKTAISSYLVGVRLGWVSPSTPSVGTFSTLTRNRSAWVALYSAEVGSRWFSVAFCTDGSPIGYSFKTNQHGLSLDTIVAFNLVLPNGTVTYVTQSTHPDLFFGLKGGFNNFVSRYFVSSPFGGTYVAPGNCDRFHDDHIPTNSSICTRGSFPTVRREFVLTPIPGWESYVPFSHLQSNPHSYRRFLGLFSGPKGCDSSLVYQLRRGSICCSGFLL